MNHSLSDPTLGAENRGCKCHFLRFQGTQGSGEKNIYIDEAREARLMNGGNIEEVVLNYWTYMTFLGGNKVMVVFKSAETSSRLACLGVYMQFEVDRK